METISQREMRNNSADVLRRVAAGETLLVTNGGQPAALLVPASATPAERLAATGRLSIGRGLDPATLPVPVPAVADTDAVLAEDRG